MDDGHRSVEHPCRVREHDERPERDPDAGTSVGRSRNLVRHESHEPDVLADGARRRVESPGGQAERREQEEGERQEEEEEPVGERAGQNPAADVRFMLELVEDRIEERNA